MPEERLKYERLVEDALRGVVRQALEEVAARGLPGEHHFYITFRTSDPGVVMPEHLRTKYPQDMTIVLQNQFWGLEVGDTAFAVTLSFNDQHERMTVPFASISGFADPAVKFGLQFEMGEPEALAKGAGSAARETKKPAAAPTDGKGADVVTLDAFRKK